VCLSKGESLNWRRELCSIISTKTCDPKMIRENLLTMNGPTSFLAMRRVNSSEWLGKQGSWDMSYEGTFGDSGYGAKAQQVLGQVRGARFQHEKNKRKKSYFGGAINDTAVNSIKFADSDDE
jgi:hypothetical protein